MLPDPVDTAKRAGWTMAALARALEVDPSTVYRWQSRPTRVLSLAIARLIETESPAEHAARGPMVTYFIREAGVIKIGRSTNPLKRLSALQVSTPAKLVLLGVCDEPEADVQRRFQELRVHGEWFQATPELLAWVSQNARKA